MGSKSKKGKGKRNAKNKNSPPGQEAAGASSSSAEQRAEDPGTSSEFPSLQESESTASHAPTDGTGSGGKSQHGMAKTTSAFDPSSVGLVTEDFSRATLDSTTNESAGSPWERSGKSKGKVSHPVSPAVGSVCGGIEFGGHQEDFPSLSRSPGKKGFGGTKTKDKTPFGDDFPSLPALGNKGCRPKNPPISLVEKVKPSAEAVVVGIPWKQQETQLKVDSPELAAPSSCTKGSAPSSSSSSSSVEATHSSKDSQPMKLVDIISSGSSHRVSSDFDFPPAKRGKSGRHINLITNYYDLTCKLPYIYHYDVAISEIKTDKSKMSHVKSPSKANSDNRSRLEKQQEARVSRKFCQEAFAKFIEILKENKKLQKLEPIYDGGKNLFTAQKLPIQDQLSFNVPLEVEGRTKHYTISLKPVKKLDGTNIINMKPLKSGNSYNLDTMNEILLVLNAIMNHRSANSQEIRVGRSFFSTSGSNRKDVGEGLEIWHGYNQSVHLTEKGPAIVLNLSARVFHKAGEAIDYIADLLGRDITQRRRPLTSFEVKKIQKALTKVRVKVTHLKYPRQYRINGVSDLSAQDLKMQIDGKEKSIAEYFGEKYGTLKFPHLHCFQMNSKNNKTFIPFEKCVILPDQHKAGSTDELSKRITSEMINATAVPPSDRFQGINNFAKRVNQICAPEMREFQLLMDLAPKKVQGRVLDAPQLRYSDGNISYPKNGTWSIAGQRFMKARRYTSWILLSFTESQQNLKKFALDLGKIFRELGLFFDEFKGILTYGNDVPTEEILSRSEVRNSSLIVIVLSKKDTYHNYDEIKFIADYCLGIVTQCVLDSVLSKSDPRILTNICLKINTKLGGVNHELALRPNVMRERVIILGIDVVHSTMCPSIAAIVGSMDRHVSTYKVCCRVQENEKRGKQSQELILDLEDMVGTILRGFLDHNSGKQPVRIVCYRDGVSEGQFRAVKDKEVESIRKASEKVYGKDVPLTFMVVQKRHQTRLRTENPRDGIGKGSNIPPGTTVDTVITYPNTFDFFLCSHEGIRGTSKPSRYTILHDGNHFDPDELQKFTYDLCYLFGRCTKSVSIPAPVKYADLAAYRAKKYADFQLKKMKRHKSSVPYTGKSSDLPQYAVEAINNMETSKNHMFFI
uniref:Putative argonaute n=1 Tax=Cupiennius salei TaxID=6928 RepID=A0A061QHS5_CUPSA